MRSLWGSEISPLHTSTLEEKKKQTKNPRFTCNLKMINLAEKNTERYFFPGVENSGFDRQRMECAC